MRAAALILAAGRGDRLGAELPKAHVCVAGRSLLAHSARALGATPGVAFVLPVVADRSEHVIAELRADWEASARLLDPVAGGKTRQESVQRGLESLAHQAPGTDWVLVHDAARCLVEPSDVLRVLEAAQSSGAAIPVVPLTDTVKEIAQGRVVGTLERSRMARAQTPQAFRADLLREALDAARRDGFEGTDCASLVERLGRTVAVCPGREENLKLTTPEDLIRVQALFELRAARGARAEAPERA